MAQLCYNMPIIFQPLGISHGHNIMKSCAAVILFIQLERGYLELSNDIQHAQVLLLYQSVV